MSLYALLSRNANPSEQEIENCFDGNVCRCTGYRPILQGAKQFCATKAAGDVEDLVPAPKKVTMTNNLMLPSNGVFHIV